MLKIGTVNVFLGDGGNVIAQWCPENESCPVYATDQRIRETIDGALFAVGEAANSRFRSEARAKGRSVAAHLQAIRKPVEYDPPNRSTP